MRSEDWKPPSSSTKPVKESPNQTASRPSCAISSPMPTSLPTPDKSLRRVPLASIVPMLGRFAQRRIGVASSERRGPGFRKQDRWRRPRSTSAILALSPPNDKRCRGRVFVVRRPDRKSNCGLASNPVKHRPKLPPLWSPHSLVTVNPAPERDQSHQVIPGRQLDGGFPGYEPRSAWSAAKPVGCNLAGRRLSADDEGTRRQATSISSPAHRRIGDCPVISTTKYAPSKAAAPRSPANRRSRL